MAVYVVRPRNADPSEKEVTRLIKAERRGQVESLLIGEISIEPAKAEECVELGAAGVRIEDATV